MGKKGILSKKRLNKVNRTLNKVMFNSYWMMILIYMVSALVIVLILTQTRVYSYIEKDAFLSSAESEGYLVYAEVAEEETDSQIILEDAVVLWSLKGDDTRYVAESVETDSNGGVHLYISPEDGVGYQKILEEKADEIVVLVPAKIVPLWHRLVDYVL